MSSLYLNNSLIFNYSILHNILCNCDNPTILLQEKNNMDLNPLTYIFENYFIDIISESCSPIEKIIELFLKFGANPNDGIVRCNGYIFYIKSKILNFYFSNFTILQVAFIMNNYKIIKMLVDYGADINKYDKENNIHPLYYLKNYKIFKKIYNTNTIVKNIDNEYNNITIKNIYNNSFFEKNEKIKLLINKNLSLFDVYLSELYQNKNKKNKNEIINMIKIMLLNNIILKKNIFLFLDDDKIFLFILENSNNNNYEDNEIYNIYKNIIDHEYVNKYKKKFNKIFKYNDYVRPIIAKLRKPNIYIKNFVDITFYIY